MSNIIEELQDIITIFSSAADSLIRDDNNSFNRGFKCCSDRLAEQLQSAIERMSERTKRSPQYGLTLLAEQATKMGYHADHHWGGKLTITEIVDIAPPQEEQEIPQLTPVGDTPIGPGDVF
jgi:ribulose 1,5-bisphosphate carboxylase large subunit-like protein